MECDKRTLDRLKRAQGQLNGILKMIDDNRSCEEVLIQLSALRTGIDRVISIVGTNNLIQAIEEDHEIERNEDIEKAIQLLVKHK